MNSILDSSATLSSQITSTALPAISLLILAGGRATRMAGLDKGLQHIDGQTLVARILQQLNANSDDVIINANRSRDDYQNLIPHARIIEDHWPDFRGPLAGIYSGLKQAHHDYLLVVPCDQFAIPEHLVERLLQTLFTQQLDVVYVSINNNPLYPFCLLHKSVLASLENHINTQQYAVRHWLFTQRAGTVNFSIDPQIPVNLNTLEQLQHAENFIKNTLAVNPLQEIV